MQRIAMKDGKATPNIDRAKWKNNSKCLWCGVLPLNWKKLQCDVFPSRTEFLTKVTTEVWWGCTQPQFCLFKKRTFTCARGQYCDGYQAFYLLSLENVLVFFYSAQTWQQLRSSRGWHGLGPQSLSQVLLYILKCFYSEVNLMRY